MSAELKGKWGRWGLDRLFANFKGAARLVVFFIGVIALLTTAFAIWFEKDFSADLRTALAEQPSPTVKILDRNGRLIVSRNQRQPHIAIDDVPQTLIDAVIATEDRRFFSHWGIDPIGIARAMWINLSEGRMREGGSTITQQLVKNLFLDHKRTFTRKFREIVIALWLEAHFSKRQILELYLNRVYFGVSGSYGVQSAARRYFNKSAHDLTLPEAAMLAGLLKAPSYYAPTHHLKRARQRASVVLDNMVDTGAITPAEASKARRHPANIRMPQKTKRLSRGSEYAEDWIFERVRRLIGKGERSITVTTTLDLPLQKKGQRMITETIRHHQTTDKVDQAAAILYDETGGIRLMVGGVSHTESQFNRAVSARRQPGSAFKPIVYLSAMEAGLTPDSRIEDEPYEIEGWHPRNASRFYRGEVTLREALARSLNAVAARLAADVGLAEVVRTAWRLGIRSPLKAHPSLALGTSETSLMELTASYLPYMTNGYAVTPHIIDRIEAESGTVLYRHDMRRSPIIAFDFVLDMNDMLATVIERGTGRAARLDGRPAAGKTGTSQNYRDAWFIGYTGQFTAGVWLGNDDGRPTNRVTGGSLPASLWRRLMLQAHVGLPVKELPRPEKLVVSDSGDIPGASLIVVNQPHPSETVLTEPIPTEDLQIVQLPAVPFRSGK